MSNPRWPDLVDLTVALGGVAGVYAVGAGCLRYALGRVEMAEARNQVSIAIGREILRLRIERGQSQRLLADLAGIDARTLRRIERGQVAEPASMFAVLAALECQIAIIPAQRGSNQSPIVITGGRNGDAARFAGPAPRQR